MGVESHSCAHFPEQVKEVLLGNVATADAMGEAFEEKKGAFTSKLRPPKTQLLVVDMGALKSPPVTGSRGRRRRHMGRAPLWPAQSMRNMSTDQGVSWRKQPVKKLEVDRAGPCRYLYRPWGSSVCVRLCACVHATISSRPSASWASGSSHPE